MVASAGTIDVSELAYDIHPHGRSLRSANIIVSVRVESVTGSSSTT